MEVFISWSGERSKALARRLNEWLPSIVPSIKPFFSEEIAGGHLWSQVLLANLESAKFGIICVTSENLHSPWLNFEAGSLLKRFNEGLPVCPVLLELRPSDLVGPLSLFQARSFTEKDIKAICRQLADLTSLPERRLAINFEAIWPLLHADVEGDLKGSGKDFDQYISISAPSPGAHVRRRPFVEGFIDDSSAEVWVIIRPLTLQKHWVQPPVAMGSDRKWKTQVYVGRSGKEDIGVRFQIRAVANPDIEMHEDLILDDWPPAEWSSAILEVIRK